MALDFDPDLAPLDDRLADGPDGYLVDAAGDVSDQRYLSGFDAPDPFVTLYDGGIHLLVSSLEYGRARSDSRADEVVRLADYDYAALAAEHGEREAAARVLAAFLDERGVESVAVPARFPLGVADGLRERGVTVEADAEPVVERVRARKADAEVDAIRAAQRANEAAIRAAADLLAGASVVDGVLHRAGEPLTSERVAEEIEVTLLRHGCALSETIVAGGADAADPHDRGSGPLPADEPIIVDVFPRSKATGYHADTTRTFCRGEPSATVREWFADVDAAREAALAAVEPGATGREVHDAACDALEEAGHPTLRSDPTTETGFIHSTGHGVGLDVHELPKVSPAGGDLEPGHVLTVEPGLYDPAVGGVRVEDLVVVTDDGYENLTEYPVELVVDA
jgi:Xaa-Pro aminopeptidase